MSLNTFISSVKSNQPVSFDETMAIINEFYTYTPTTFTNGLGDQTVINAAGSNEGSCKIFAFAQLNQLDQQQTLELFGEHYQDVLQDPDGSSHQNIRKFMHSGWTGIQLANPDALVIK
ncbi:MAG TPA: type III effector [Methyloprofundus sp.]|uniref:HopJ type III effector protein n=1 Tax=Methyloprofundus sp. TaxID=2020875 RepID=UPI00180F441C|nr:HopJ type III effector protein [Methyloprofundus sp.]HIG64743.1 type III effector [Methyloprofundus sp.]HIL79576.1 type III effector [Methylococcales bacterium]